MQQITNLCKTFPGLGSPSKAAKEYGFFHPDFWDSLEGEDLFQFDLDCLSEHNRIEIEQMEMSQKDNEFKSKHPGAENYPDMATRWDKAKAAAGQK